MPLRGDLQELRLFDLLQMVATTGRSGRLVLTHSSGRGLVVFRQGRIVYAASDSLRETLGSLLVSLGLLDQERLRRGLEIQRQRDPQVCLGTVLVDEGWLSEEDLEDAITRQVERVVAELGSWSEGYFEFTQMEVPSRGEVSVDARDLLLERGLSADHVLLSIAVQLDEAGRQPGPGGSVDVPERVFDLAELASGRPDGAASVPRIDALRDVLAQVRSPRLTGETIELLLSTAVRLVRRVILFSVHSDIFRGLAQRGLEGTAAGAIGDVQIPIAAEGLLRRAAASREVVRGPLSTDPGDARLLAALGGPAPAGAVVAPMAVGEKVGLVVYGDNLPRAEPIGSVEELELILLQTGLAMERAALRERIRQLEFDEVLRSRG